MTVYANYTRFQSTLPRGERPLSVDVLMSFNTISIHAPTRGATTTTDIQCFHSRYFNPRSHEGSDADYIDTVVPPRGFQSTLPRGERRRTADGADRRCYFNPRSHEGSDPGSHCRRQPGAYFNPRSHEGSDDDKPCVESIRVNFNPRSHEGSDMLSVFRSKAFVISIHAPTRGATLYYLQGQTHSHDFNPRSHEGSDAFNILCYLLTFYFNPRSHEGSDTSVEHSPRYSEISIHAPTRGATLYK